MSTEDTVAQLQKSLETALSRIGSLEGELRGKKPEVPQGIDPTVLRNQLTLDPIAALRGYNIPDETITHLRTCLIADLLGDAAPQHMKDIARSGKQVIATQASNAAVADLSRRFDELTTGQKNKQKRDEFNAITAMKDKYPNLAKAATAKPELFTDSLVKHGGTAEEFAVAEEARLAEVAAALGVPTTSVNNVDNKDQSKKVVSAPLASALNGAVPDITQGSKPSSWNQESHNKLRDEIVAKVSSRI